MLSINKMGCSCTKDERKESFQLRNIVQKGIKSNSTRDLQKIVHGLQSSFLQRINEPFTQIDNVPLNPLAYAIWNGKVSSFKYLHSQGACPLEMERQLSIYGLSGLGLLCKAGNLEVLQVYLPIWLGLDFYEVKDFTIDFEAEPFTPKSPTYTAVQLAVAEGHIHIIDFFQKYFKNTKPPLECDVHYVNETTGDNCALIACMKGNYTAVRYLHEKCEADFHLKNCRNESAIQVAAAASKHSDRGSYFEIIKYLVDTVKVDLLYQYEETLLLTDRMEILNLIERRLEGSGIEITKLEVELSNRLEVLRKPRQKEEEVELVLDQIKNEVLCESFISEISSADSKNGTPFSSILENISYL